MEKVRFRLTKGEKGVYVQETDERGSYLLQYGPFTSYRECWARIRQAMQVMSDDMQEPPLEVRQMFN